MKDKNNGTSRNNEAVTELLDLGKLIILLRILSSPELHVFVKNTNPQVKKTNFLNACNT